LKNLPGVVINDKNDGDLNVFLKLLKHVEKTESWKNAGHSAWQQVDIPKKKLFCMIQNWFGISFIPHQLRDN